MRERPELCSVRTPRSGVMLGTLAQATGAVRCPGHILQVEWLGDGDDEARLVAQAPLGSHEAATALLGRHWPTVWQVAYAVLGSRATVMSRPRGDDQRLAALESFDEQRPLDRG